MRAIVTQLDKTKIFGMLLCLAALFVVAVNRRWIFTPDRRAIGTPLVDGLERVET